MLAARRMRIAIVTDYYYPQLGGITEHVHGQALHLTRRGHDVTVVTGHLLHTPPVVDRERQSAREEPFEVVRLGVALPLYGNASQTLHTVPLLLTESLRRLFRHRGFDVVHCHAPYNPGMCLIAPLALPRRAIGVGTYHSVFEGGAGLDTFAPLMRWSISRLDAHVVVSEACVGSLAPYFPFAYRVIPNGIEDDHFSPDAEPIASLRDGRPVILFVGRFDPRNGLSTMLRAFARVHEEHAGAVRLVVVGDGPLRQIYRRQLEPAVAADVHFAGRVDWERPRYYATADIHCTPCNKASFGMVLLEAMSCGKPVVASRISGFQLLMEHGRQGLLVRPADDADRFAQALLYLLDRPAERARMGREGRRTAVTRYSWSRVAEQLELLYEELLAAPRRRGRRRG
jgi:phosphatidylinositol alpha-mannosyltransferase